MRKILLTMFAAVALIGCNREDVPISPQEQHAISFDNVSTRAGLSDLQRDGFGVWATVSSIGSNDVSYQPLFEEEELVYIPTGKTEWTYDNEQLWISNSIFHFFAAYPYNIGFEQVRFEYGGKYFTACYKEMSADGATEPVDILVATYVTDTTDENFDPNNAVPLLFKHLHTKINFKIRQNFKLVEPKLVVHSAHRKVRSDSTAFKTLELFYAGFTIAEIAKKRKITIRTVVKHLRVFIEQDVIHISNFTHTDQQILES